MPYTSRERIDEARAALVRAGVRGAAARVALGAALCGGLLALPGDARADEPRYPLKSDQIVRTGPFTSASKVGSVEQREMVEIHCQDYGDSVGGSRLWDFIQYDVDGRPGLKKSGWVPDSTVTTGTSQPLNGVKQGDCPAPQIEPGPARPRPAAQAPPPQPAPAPPPPATTPPATLRPAKVSLRPSRHRFRNGQTLVLRGRLRGSARPRGVLVELQARRGRSWQTFGTVATRRGGVFRFPYRFSRTLGVQRYRLRARVPKQRGYPYRTGASRSVRVRVAG